MSIKWTTSKNIDRFFDNRFGRLYESLSEPAIDVYEKEGNVLVEMHVPGINPNNVDISVEGDKLRVSGAREENKEAQDQDYYQKEIRRGEFERIITLPHQVIPEETKAEFKDGILKILLPKKIKVHRYKVKIEKK